MLSHPGVAGVGSVLVAELISLEMKMNQGIRGPVPIVPIPVSPPGPSGPHRVAQNGPSASGLVRLGDPCARPVALLFLT